MLDAVAALAFAGFLIVALALRLPVSSDAARRRRINVFLLYVLAASFTAGLTQRDLWPFSAWPLVAGTIEDEVTHGRIVAVDTAGEEHRVDYRAWHPLSFDELMSWMDGVFVTLAPAEQDLLAATLLEMVERARNQARSGERFGTSKSLLGPFSAPFFLLHPRIWNHPEDAPSRELVGLRYHLETWSLEARARGSDELRRRLVYESPELR